MTETMTVKAEFTSQVGGEFKVCPICECDIDVFENYIFLHPTGQRVTICFKCAERIFKDAEIELVEGSNGT